MSSLFGFGFSQEDELTVSSALDVKGQTVLCVASGGDIPLSLLARGARQVISVDISEAQLHLCRLKVAALQCLDRVAAAGLLGFTAASPAQRMIWLGACMPQLSEPTAAFWRLHESQLSSRGAIWCGKYELFLRKLQLVIRPLLGHAFYDLMHCTSPEEQDELFDRRIGRPWLRAFFRLAFSRQIYPRYGVDERSVANRSSDVPLGEQYWAQLRSFCTATPAGLNPWLQIHALGQLISLDSAPYYLGEGFSTAKQQSVCTSWAQSDVFDFVRQSLPADVTRVYLSNLPDWCSAPEFERVVRELVLKMPPESRIVWSYLHVERQLPAEMLPTVRAENLVGSPLGNQDRFPFYKFTRVRVAGSQS